MTSLRIGDPVQVHETSEVLTLVCLDNGRAWVRDGAGNHLDYPEEDLVRAHSRAYRREIMPEPIERNYVSELRNLLAARQE